MYKSIFEKDFFTREAYCVAQDLLGKYICDVHGQKYLITETEAYYHNEKVCYGSNIEKEKAKKLRRVSAALFEEPGTWCVYGGQLLLSVKDSCFSDNVLIKRVKDETGEILGPDRMAKCLHLYKKYLDYCNCHNLNSIAESSALYLAEGVEIGTTKINSCERVHIKDGKKLRFIIQDE